MRILLSNFLDNTTLASYQNILKVFVYGGHECIVWDKSKKSTFDMFDEFKPDIYISKKLDQLEEKCIKNHNCKWVETNSAVWADCFLYKKTEPNDLFKCDFMSIINHDESEIKKIESYLNKGSSYKLFSPFKFMATEYCQNIPDEMHSLALSSANKVIATNFLNFFNFTLANVNTIYPKYAEKEHYSKDDILNNITCFIGAKLFLEDNKIECDIDVKKLYEDFRNKEGI